MRLTTFDQLGYRALLPFCKTARQTEIIEACVKYGSNSKTAKELGLARQTVDNAVQRVVKNKASAGYNPQEYDLRTSGMPGQVVKGVSQHFDKDGQPSNFWVKTTAELETLSKVLDMMENFEYKPLPNIPKSRTRKDADLLNLLTLSDFHLGMYAWAPETGADWDMKIAQKVALNAIQDMIARLPPAKEVIFCNNGDFLHWDSLDAVTPTAGHILDADSRADFMIELAMDIHCWIIELLLRHYDKVHVYIVEGNHDQVGSVWLRKHCKKLFAKNPRVRVDDTAFPYYAHLHGKCMIGFHHGHKKKNASLPGLFSNEPRYREMWGQATKTYIHVGHYHEDDLDTVDGTTIRRHPTMAARDAYAARGGYLSDRGALGFTYHVTEGEICRVTVRPRT